MNVNCVVPLSPSATDASATDTFGTTGAGPPVDDPLTTNPVTADDPPPGAAWKPNSTLCPAATFAFHDALRTT